LTEKPKSGAPFHSALSIRKAKGVNLNEEEIHYSGKI